MKILNRIDPFSVSHVERAFKLLREFRVKVYKSNTQLGNMEETTDRHFHRMIFTQISFLLLGVELVVMVNSLKITVDNN